MSREERERKRAERKRRSRNIRVAVSASVLTLSLAGIGNLVSFGGDTEALTPTKTSKVMVGEVAFITPKVPLNVELQMLTQKYCREYAVPYSLVLAVIQTESSFEPDAVNESCYGLMQIHAVHENDLRNKLGVTDFTEPKQNLHSGIYLLSELYEKYGDWQMALVAYNCGNRGAYENYFSQGQYASGYSWKVLSAQEEWEAVIG